MVDRLAFRSDRLPTEHVDRRFSRNKRLSLDEAERDLLAEVRGRYEFIPGDELEQGWSRMRVDALAAGASWIDARPTYLLTAKRARLT